jgi:hypothetical protein
VTPEQRLMRQIIIDTAKTYLNLDIPVEFSVDKIGALWEFLEENHYDELQDLTETMRSSGEETGLECEYSRHYASKAVARQLDDGSWVGWTYWYGGGKHSNPEEVEWIDSAYYVDVKQETKVVNVFSKKESGDT